MAYHKADEKQLLDDRGYSGKLIRGQNPALLFEKGVRERIIDSFYWKEQCFGLNTATLCDRAVELNCIGGTYGAMGKPTPFLCLAFKLLQLVPEKKVILELLNFSDDVDEDRDENEERQNGHENVEGPYVAKKPKGDFKYLRALAAFYIRLAWEPVEIHKTLEPLLTDFRKLKRRTKETFALTYVDQFVDDLLVKDRVCATSLWKMPSRTQLEDLDLLEPRESVLAGEVEEMDEEGDENGSRSRDGGSQRGRSRSYSDEGRYSSRSRSRSRSRSPRRDRSRSDSRQRRRRSRSYDSRRSRDSYD